jgi:hypothetical protein
MVTISHQYYIPASESTPEVRIDFLTGEISLIGRSLIHNVPNFFVETIQDIHAYTKIPNNQTTVTIHLEYFGDESGKKLIEVLRILEAVHRKKTDVVVKWIYNSDNKEMKATGQDFDNVINLPFQLVENKNV